MLRAYQYRIYSKAEQQEMLAKTFGCVRLIYNSGLETKNTAYRLRGVPLSCLDLIKQMKEAKNDMPFLSDVPSQALQMALRNLDNAFTNFFRHGAAFPCFKSKHRKQSFQLPQGVKCNFKSGKVFLSKCKWVDAVLHRQFEGTIKTTTVSRTPTGKNTLDLPIGPGGGRPKPKPVDRSTGVGSDLGIKNFLITSDGEVFENQNTLTGT